MTTYEKRREKTKGMIKDAFWILYEKNDINQITIHELAEISGIHRATFYQYYHDIYEVLEEIEEELLNSLKKLDIEHMKPTARELYRFIDLIYNEYNQHRKYLHLLLIGNKDPDFSKKYQYTFFSLFPDEIKLDDNQKIQLIEGSMIYGLIVMITYFIDSNELSSREISHLILSLLLRGIVPTVGNIHNIVKGEN